MKYNSGLKIVGMLCTCAAIVLGISDTALAGPSTGYESDILATVDAENVSIYADDDEASGVIAMAQKGGVYEVVEEGENNWVKVAAGELEGYVKVQGEVMLTRAAEVTAAAEEFVEEQSIAELRQNVVDYALQFVGNRYVWGGTDPNTGADCSGFTRYVMKHAAGISLNRSSVQQAKQGTTVSVEDVQPGDLVFYGNGKRVNHVAIYIGDGKIVHASTERTGIKTSDWDYRSPIRIANVIG